MITANIYDMTCASCAKRVENALSSLSGVHEANVNFAASKATISYDPSALTTDDMKRVVEDIEYSMSFEEEEEADPEQLKISKAARKMWIAASSASVIMVLMTIHMFFVPIPGYFLSLQLLQFPRFS